MDYSIKWKYFNIEYMITVLFIIALCYYPFCSEIHIDILYKCKNKEWVIENISSEIS